MNHRSTELLRDGAGRRPRRFRTQVEMLDVRRLLATGLSATPIPLFGNVASPIRVTEYDLGAINTPDHNYPLAPVGTPIQLLTLTNSSTSTLSSTGYAGTIDWGDGSKPDAALFGTYTLPSYEVVPPNAFLVDGPEHTYAKPGTYSISIAVTGPGDPTPTIYSDTASISSAPVLTGQLNPASDTGLVNSDGVTADNTPNYFGTTEPGATVVLSATSLITGQTLVVGSSVADTTGQWSITTVPFVNGFYSLTATATDPAGNFSTLSLAGQINASQSLTIDSTGPQIESFAITNAKTGAFQFNISDVVGIVGDPLLNPSSYVVTRPSPTPRKGQTFPVLNLNQTFLTTQQSGEAFGSDLVTGTLSTGKALITKNGTYVFTIHSAGLTSLSGATLDGEYSGKFPTGNGQPGGDFQVKISVRNGKASGPIAITPVKATTATIKVKTTTRLHA